MTIHPGLAEPRTKEEWRGYLDATPPPRPEMPSYAEYQRWSPEARRQFDASRHAHHSALVIVRTAAMSEIHTDIGVKMLMNAHQEAGARRGLVVDGPPTVGKSTLVKVFAAEYERALRQDHPERFDGMISEGLLADYVPVVYVSIPSQATPKDLSILIAEWLHQPFRKSATKTEITTLVLQALRACGTRLVIIDDIHFLNLSVKEGKAVNDHLKYLANHCAATFVYTGHDLEHSGLFLEGSGSERATQTSGRYTRHSLDLFKIGTTDQVKNWARVIKPMEDALVLFRHQPNSLTARHWNYLHERTSGSIASLSALLREAAIRAVMSGEEAITKKLLATIVLDRRATRDYQQRRRRTAKTTSLPATSQPAESAG